MKTMVTLSLAALCAFASLPASATNPDTGVPHLHRSPGTTISTPPRFGMVTQEGGEGVLPVRLERSLAAPEQVRVGLHEWEPCGQGFPLECGRPLDELPEIVGFGGMTRGLADVTVPAVMRKDGLHGPIRTDLSFSNPAGAMVMATLQLVGSGGGERTETSLASGGHLLRERRCRGVGSEGNVVHGVPFEDERPADPGRARRAAPGP